jgi:hypothetical protein
LDALALFWHSLLACLDAADKVRERPKASSPVIEVSGLLPLRRPRWQRSLASLARLPGDPIASRRRLPSTDLPSRRRADGAAACRGRGDGTARRGKGGWMERHTVASVAHGLTSLLTSCSRTRHRKRSARSTVYPCTVSTLYPPMCLFSPSFPSFPPLHHCVRIQRSSTPAGGCEGLQRACG